VNPIGPRACYDEGKRCAETLAVSYARQYDVATRIVRIFNTYGPRMHENDGRVVSNFVLQALRDEPITIYGDGSQTRSFCFVTDLIDGFVRFMATPKDVIGPINLGNPVEFTVLELAEALIALTGSRSKLRRLPLPADDPRQRQPDIARARALLDWQPKIGLETGLRTTIEYFDKLLSRPHRAPAGLHVTPATVANVGARAVGH
jgi:UDP-glucuronate decarboxylase